MKVQCDKSPMRTLSVILIFGMFLFDLISFNTSDTVAYSETPIPVHVSIEPLITFVKRIGGDRVSVYSLVPPGASPETYSPTPIQMSKLSKSKLFFRIGVPFEESLIKRIRGLAKQIIIVDMRKGITLRKMESMHDHDKSDEQDKISHEKSHGDTDPHIWLNPVLVQKQAETICDALISVDPKGRQIYEANQQMFLNDLEILHQKIQQSLLPVKGGTLFVFHPSFGYFADAYGLKQMAVQVEGKAPKGKDLSRFIKQAKKEKVRVVFIQPQFDENTAKKIANAIDGIVITLDPLSRDYFKNMEAMADKVAASLNK